MLSVVYITVQYSTVLSILAIKNNNKYNPFSKVQPISSDQSKESPTESKADKPNRRLVHFFPRPRRRLKKTAETVKEKGKEFDEKHGQRIKEKTKQAAENIA